jgi:hypothetical protein
MSVARAEFSHPLTKSVDVLRAEVGDILNAGLREFPMLSVEAGTKERPRSLHLFVSGHPILVRMLKVRLLYRGWKLVGRVQLAETVSVRPTVPLEHDPLVWASVASAARNTVAPMAPNMSMMHMPSRMGQASAMGSRHHSAMRYGVGMPYDETAARVMGYAQSLHGSSEDTASSEQLPTETEKEFKARKRHTRSIRAYRERQNILARMRAAAEKEQRQQAAMMQWLQQSSASQPMMRTTRKARGSSGR